MIKLNKKAEGLKWEIVIGLLVGLLVVGIIFYGFFYEYFTQEEIDWETCRQSILLRNTAPDMDLYATTIQFKDKFPLKCKTSVVNIDYKDVKKAEKAVADEIASCWGLFGKGGYSIYPSAKWNIESSCFICARIHIDSKVRDFYSDKNNIINFQRALNYKISNSQTYFDYLFNSEPQKTIGLFGGWGQEFKVDDQTHGRWWFDPTYGYSVYVFPKEFIVDDGDLFVTISSVPFSTKKTGNFLLFYQDKDGKVAQDLSTKEAFVVGYDWAYLGESWTTCDTTAEIVPA